MADFGLPGGDWYQFLANPQLLDVLLKHAAGVAGNTMSQAQFGSQMDFKRQELAQQAALSSAQLSLQQAKLGIDRGGQDMQNQLAQMTMGLKQSELSLQRDLGYGQLDLERMKLAVMQAAQGDQSALEREKMALQREIANRGFGFQERQIALAEWQAAADQQFKIAQLVASLRGPRNAFVQQAVLYGLNSAGLSKAVDYISGEGSAPRYQADQAKPEPATLETFQEDTGLNLSGPPTSAAGRAGASPPMMEGWQDVVHSPGTFAPGGLRPGHGINPVYGSPGYNGAYTPGPGPSVTGSMMSKSGGKGAAPRNADGSLLYPNVGNQGGASPNSSRGGSTPSNQFSFTLSPSNHASFELNPSNHASFELTPGAGSERYERTPDLDTLARLYGIPSAAVGSFKVPKDQFMLVHKDEAILPKPVAQGFRQQPGVPDAGPVVHLSAGSGLDASTPPTGQRQDLTGTFSPAGAAANPATANPTTTPAQCPAGQHLVIYDQATYDATGGARGWRCDIDQATNCPVGYHWDSTSNQCVADDLDPHNCPTGSTWSPAQNACVLNSGQPNPTGPGWRWLPDFETAGRTGQWIYEPPPPPPPAAPNVAGAGGTFGVGQYSPSMNPLEVSVNSGRPNSPSTSYPDSPSPAVAAALSHMPLPAAGGAAAGAPAAMGAAGGAVGAPGAPPVPGVPPMGGAPGQPGAGGAFPGSPGGAMDPATQIVNQARALTEMQNVANAAAAGSTAASQIVVEPNGRVVVTPGPAPTAPSMEDPASKQFSLLDRLWSREAGDPVGNPQDAMEDPAQRRPVDESRWWDREVERMPEEGLGGPPVPTWGMNQPGYQGVDLSKYLSQGEYEQYRAAAQKWNDISRAYQEQFYAGGPGTSAFDPTLAPTQQGSLTPEEQLALRNVGAKLGRIPLSAYTKPEGYSDFQWAGMVAHGNPATGSPGTVSSGTPGMSDKYKALLDRYGGKLPQPNQIVAREWLNLTPDTQQFLLGAYEALGYSASDVLHTILNTLPGRAAWQGAQFGLIQR